MQFILENVPVHRCPSCGEEEIEIPRIEQLHSIIASLVATKEERLLPGEIRWLRTYLGYSSVDFAKLMGVSAETVSRWERLDAPKRMQLPSERLLRLMALHEKPIRDYSLLTMGTKEPKKSGQAIRVRARRDTWALPAA